MDSKVLDEAVEVALKEWYRDKYPYAPEAMRAALLAGVKVLLGEPVAWQYQGRGGEWRNFVDEHHRVNTVADGSWPIRVLYAPSLGEGDGR